MGNLVARAERIGFGSVHYFFYLFINFFPCRSGAGTKTANNMTATKKATKATANEVAPQVETKVGNSNLTNTQVGEIIRLIGEEGKSLGAVVRDFLEVAKRNATAEYILRTISADYTLTDGEEPKAPIWVRLTVNDLRNKIVEAFPYKDGRVMLHKVNGVFVPYTEYTADIIRKAFYNAVGATKVPKDFRPATAEEVAKAEAEAETKKAERKATAEQKKADADLKAKLWAEVMEASSAEQAWAVVLKYKARTTKTESTK